MAQYSLFVPLLGCTKLMDFYLLKINHFKFLILTCLDFFDIFRGARFDQNKGVHVPLSHFVIPDPNNCYEMSPSDVHLLYEHQIYSFWLHHCSVILKNASKSIFVGIGKLGLE